MDSFYKTAITYEQVGLTFLLDNDDPTRGRYPGRTIVGDPTGDPTGPLNRQAIVTDEPIIGFCGDDTRFETVGWDLKVLEALRTPGFVWGGDGHEVPWPSTVFITRTITDALGWMVPPTLRRGYFDVVWLNLARLTKTDRVLKDVMFRHDNSAGDPMSPNFKASYQVPPHIIASDQSAFDHWQANDMKRDAQRIRHAIFA